MYYYYHYPKASPRAAGPLDIRGQKRYSVAFVGVVAAAAAVAAVVVVVVVVVVVAALAPRVRSYQNGALGAAGAAGAAGAVAARLRWHGVMHAVSSGWGGGYCRSVHLR